MNDSDHAKNIVSARKNFIEFFAITLMIALGVNFLAAGISATLLNSATSNTMIGIVLILFFSSYLILRSSIKLRKSKFMSGIFLIDENSDIIPVYRYKFSEDLSETFTAAKAENKALFRGWGRKNSEDDNHHHFIRSSNSIRLLNEMIEYFIVSKLSLHLNAYFINNELVSEDELVRLDRNKVPDILLQNRILDLFSRPMQDRDAFEDFGDDPYSENIVLSYGKNGAIFDRFEIELPKKTIFTRDSEGNLILKTPRFSMIIETEVSGMNANTPRHFEKLYMKKDFMQIDAFKASIKISTKFHITSIFSGKGWEYFLWIDSFIDSLDASFSFKRFIKHIGWETALTHAIIQKPESHKNPENSDETDAARIVITKTSSVP